MGGTTRSRNASATSQTSVTKGTVQMSLPETKIFSVAVEAKRAEQTRTDAMRVCDVDTDFSGRFAVVSRPVTANNVPTVVNSKKKSQESSGDEVFHAAVEEIVQKKVTSESATSGKKGKKKKNKKGSKSSCSSADESQAVETKKEEPVKVKQAQSREVTPPKKEDLVDLDNGDEGEFVPVKASKSKQKDLMYSAVASKVRVEEEENKTVGDDTSDEFMEITNTKNDTDVEEEEEEKFFIKEDSLEDDELAEPPVKVDPGWTAMANCVDELLKPESSDAILLGIKNAEKKWECSKEKKMAESTGFTVEKDSSDVGAADSSEDDFDFRPAFVRKSAKNKEKRKSDVSSGSFADSESSLLADEKSAPESGIRPDNIKDGWSFEDDNMDILNLLLSKPAEEGKAPQEEEKTALEDVFKFDSELAARSKNEEDDEEEEESIHKAVSLEDLNKETNAMTTDDSDGKDTNSSSNGKSGKKMTTSLNVTFDEESLISVSAARESVAGMTSSSVGSTSESSVGNSPNPKKNKGKKKKKKKVF